MQGIQIIDKRAGFAPFVAAKLEIVSVEGGYSVKFTNFYNDTSRMWTGTNGSTVVLPTQEDAEKCLRNFISVYESIGLSKTLLPF